MSTKNYDGWCIEWPDGTMLLSEAHTHRAGCLSRIVEFLEDDWPKLYRDGFRCVKVRIEKVKP